MRKQHNALKHLWVDWYTYLTSSADRNALRASKSNQAVQEPEKDLEVSVCAKRLDICSLMHCATSRE